MHIWLLCFLLALVASLAYGFWLAGYAQRHGWSEKYARSRAALAPYCAGTVLVLIHIAVRIGSGKGWTVEGSPAEALFSAMLGFLVGGGLTTIVVLRRIRPN